MKRKTMIIPIFFAMLFSILFFCGNQKVNAKNDTQYQIYSESLKRINTATVKLKFKCKHAFEYYSVYFKYKNKKTRKSLSQQYLGIRKESGYGKKIQKNKECNYKVPISNKYDNIVCTLKIYDDLKLKRTETIKLR